MVCCRDPIEGLFGPEFILQRNMPYRSHPVASRVAMGTVATISGIIMPFLSPLLAALGFILMPILAGVVACMGDSKGAKGYLQAWGVSVFTLAASVAFMSLTTFYLPLIWSSVLAISLIGLSVILHVRKAMKDPI